MQNYIYLKRFLLPPEVQGWYLTYINQILYYLEQRKWQLYSYIKTIRMRFPFNSSGILWNVHRFVSLQTNHTQYRNTRIHITISGIIVWFCVTPPPPTPLCRTIPNPFLFFNIVHSDLFLRGMGHSWWHFDGSGFHA